MSISMSGLGPAIRATFSNEDLSGVEYNGDDLSYAIFQNCDLSGAYIVETNLSHCRFMNCDLSRSMLKHCSMHGAIFMSDLSYSSIDGCTGNGTIFRRAGMRNITVRESALVDADFSSARLSDAMFFDSKLYGSDFYNTTMWDTKFHNCNLNETVLDERIVKKNRSLYSGSKGRIVYRTSRTIYANRFEYHPGRTYVAPLFSSCPVTKCHPGIYFFWRYSDAQRYAINRDDMRVVKCYVRAGEFVPVKDGGRAKRIRILGYVD